MFNFRKNIHKLNNIIGSVAEFVIVAVDISTVSYPTQPEVCMASPSYSTKYFYSNTGLPYPSTGEMLFNEIGLTTAFVGDNTFYKLSWSGGTGSNQIDSLGEAILNTSVCP
jgi:hypothetical protein